MPRDIPEADWKICRRLKEIALERFCERILSEIGSVSANEELGYHKRYLAVWDLIQRQNDELGIAFDNLRRSSALRQLAKMKSLGLLTAEEFSQFSEQTRAAVDMLATYWT